MMPVSSSDPDGPLHVLGVKISPIDMDLAVSTIETWIELKAQNYVCITGVHGVMASQSDVALREIHAKAGLVTPDGMPLVWMARRLGFRKTQRVYGPDLMRVLTSRSESRGYRHFYYGGGEGLADRLAAVLKTQHPNLNVAGTYCPPFRPLTEDEDAKIIERINQADPDIVWVGLSTPKQEYWMASHIGRLKAPVLIGVGAAFDFLSGTKPQAPLWMQRNGLEWLFRLSSEPRRLWRRYFTIVPSFLVKAAAQLMRQPNSADGKRARSAG
jgi:N-acetylglucosaminyldiphosphoundecaprenol N-acetyl-beta-D-mannosaminyltransferase